MQKEIFIYLIIYTVCGSLFLTVVKRDYPHLTHRAWLPALLTFLCLIGIDAIVLTVPSVLAYLKPL